MGMTEAAVALFHESLSKQELNSNPIDCYFYSDYLVPRYIDANLAIPLISLTQYTYPSRLVFSDGTFKREGMNDVIQWMVDNRNKGYFQNLKFFQITRHKAATFEATSNGAALQANIVANLKTMCQDTINFPVLEEMNFDANAYNEYNNGFDTALLNACNDVTVRTVTIKANVQGDRPITMCSTSQSSYPNYEYYDMTNPAEVTQCRYTWNWELFDEFSRYAPGPYPNEYSVRCYTEAPTTTQPPTTQAPTTQPPTTQAPTTQPPTTQPPTPTSTPTPTPTPEPWFPIYDPFILGDNCNYESQDTCIEQIISDLDVLRLCYS